MTGVRGLFHVSSILYEQARTDSFPHGKESVWAFYF